MLGVAHQRVSNDRKDILFPASGIQYTQENILIGLSVIRNDHSIL